jgi:hypothetical protein
MLDTHGIIKGLRLTQARHLDAARDLLYHNLARSVGLCESKQPHSTMERVFYVSKEDRMPKELTPEQREYRREYARKWREQNRESIRAKYRNWAEQHRESIRKSGQKYYASDRDRETERKRKYRQENPDHLRALSIKRRYALSTDEYNQLMAAQDSKCAICGKESKKLDIDHDHETGKVRGLLCGPCNRKLHAIENKTFMAAALAYLAER